MRRVLIAPLVLWAAVAARADALPDGWHTAVDSNAAARAAKDFGDNVLHCTWAGDKPKVAAALPANVSFQLAVAGKEEDVSNVQAILDEAAAALPAKLLSVVRRFRLLAPTLQWMVRSVRCASPDRSDYLGSAIHPAAFAAADIDRDKLLEFARNVSPAQLPPAATVWLEEEETAERQPLSPAVPGVDYPGVLPEVTFATPFGIGIVVRAPESPRVFKFRAAAFPASNAQVSFAWTVLSGGSKVQAWDKRRQTKNGYGRIVLDYNALDAKGRIDVAVFARWGSGPWGAPSIISFYASPYEVRNYQGNALVGIRYLPKAKTPPPYDLSAICTPADWKDLYQHDEKNRIVSFMRVMPNEIKGEDFSARNERIVESHPNGTPKLAEKISYFVKDGQLQFKETGEQVSYKLETFTPRRWLSRLGSNQD